jgi:hypothetical protein
MFNPRRNHTFSRIDLGRPRRCRRGSALLLCTLAATVISLAAIAIVRSNQHQLATVQGMRAARQARCTADGMLQRAYATIRLDQNFTGLIPLAKSNFPEARVEVRALSATATQVDIYLYKQAKQPARTVVVDPVKLASSVKPPDLGLPSRKPPVAPVTSLRAAPVAKN